MAKHGTQASQRGSENGFISDMGKTFSTTFGGLLPVWAAKELELQNVDGLTDSLSKANNPNPNTGNDPNIKKTFLDLSFGGTKISGIAIASSLIGVAVVGAVLFFALKKS